MTAMSQFVFLTLLLLIQEFSTHRFDFETGTPCGKLFIKEGKIIGGRDAVQGEVPWIASIILNNRFQCGSSIIAKRWIITAAHCFYRYPLNDVSVRVGNIKVRNAVRIPVERIFMHPNYKRPNDNSNDIALVKLRRDIVFNNVTWPICLDRKRVNLNNRQATVAGWGKLREGMPIFPQILKLVRVPIINNQNCEQLFNSGGTWIRVEDSQICAGLRRGGKDACQGDSGGPLYIATKRSSHTLVGIVSFGYGCARPRKPGLYARVSSFISWIDRVMRY